jgi:leader peptidase (prepilin peptidase) / N-methyltransferase
VSAGFLIVVVGVFGLLIGSFLNAWAYRLPREISIARGRSFCPACAAPIHSYDNVPLVSYLMLRGRCRACGAHISVRYPLGEAGTAALFVLAAVLTGPSWLLPPQLLFISVLVLLTQTDLEFREVPGDILLISGAVGLGTMIALHPHRWWVYVAASLGAAGFLLLIRFLYKVVRGVTGMGIGDVSISFFLGAFLGAAVVPAMFLGFLLGAVAGIAVLARNGGDTKTALPFGPFLAAGGVVMLFAGQSVIHAYLSLIGG